MCYKSTSLSLYNYVSFIELSLGSLHGVNFINIFCSFFCLCNNLKLFGLIVNGIWSKILMSGKYISICKLSNKKVGEIEILKAPLPYAQNVGEIDPWKQTKTKTKTKTTNNVKYFRQIHQHRHLFELKTESTSPGDVKLRISDETLPHVA